MVWASQKCPKSVHLVIQILGKSGFFFMPDFGRLCGNIFTTRVVCREFQVESWCLGLSTVKVVHLTSIFNPFVPAIKHMTLNKMQKMYIG